MPAIISMSRAEVDLSGRGHTDAYANAFYLARMKEAVRQGEYAKMAFLDIDATLTGNNKAAERVKALLVKQGYTIVYVTTRPEEMCMSQQQYQASMALGLDRPPPFIDKSDPRQFKYQDPAEHPDFQPVIDPDIIASQTGNRILVGQRSLEGLDGYLLDIVYDEALKRGSADWRKDTLAILREFDTALTERHLSPIDRDGIYEKHKIDVDVLQNRINLDFVAEINKHIIDTPGATSAGIETPLEQQEMAYREKESFIKRFRAFQETYGGTAYRKEFNELQTTYHETFADAKEQLEEHEYLAFRDKRMAMFRKEKEDLQLKFGLDPQKVAAVENIQFIEDSNPDKGRYSLYLMPAMGHKERAVNEIVQRTCEAIGIERNDLELLFAGDSLPDVSMGLHGGLGTQATFLIVGGSRLTDALVDPRVKQFAGTNLVHIKQRLIKKSEGFYDFHEPLGLPPREVIIGHYAYPGTTGPETILAYLEQLEN